MTIRTLLGGLVVYFAVSIFASMLWSIFFFAADMDHPIRKAILLAFSFVALIALTLGVCFFGLHLMGAPL